MNDLNSPGTPSPTSSSEVAELRSTCDALVAQTQTLQVVLLLVVGALCLFFWREAGFNGAQATQMQPQVTQISQAIAQLEKQGGSMEKQLQSLQAAALHLAEYGKTHPDYAQILAKYGIVIQPAAPAATAAPAAKPASPATPLKK